MKLSIITINYNDCCGLKKTIESVWRQTARNEIEHIVVDGGSTDGSAEYLQTNTEKIDHWVSERDKGIYNAMNKGIRMASGDYIQILNAGDCLAAPDVTVRMLEALERTNYPDIMYGNMLKTSDWKHFNRDRCGDGRYYTPQSFLYFYCGTLNHDCAYIRRTLFDTFGYYNELMQICSDWEWYVRTIVLGKVNATYVDIDVTHFDMNGISESGNKNREIIERERRAYLEQVLPSAVLVDYDTYSFPILQYIRLKKYHLWGIVHFVERVLFKLEKWRLLR